MWHLHFVIEEHVWPQLTSPQFHMAMKQALKFLSDVSRWFLLCYWPHHMQFLLISAGFQLSYQFFLSWIWCLEFGRLAREFWDAESCRDLLMQHHSWDLCIGTGVHRCRCSFSTPLQDGAPCFWQLSLYRLIVINSLEVISSLFLPKCQKLHS